MLSAIFSNAYVVLVVILFFGVTIFIHELGHYLVARWCGLVVKTFSIGFGPAIWQRKVNGIVYKIGWIPFGGYVSLPQLDPTAMEAVQGKVETDETTEAEEPLPRVAGWKKILVSVAGATGNVILAVAIAWTVYLVGMPATTANQDSVLGFVAESSEVHAAGFRMGDRIVSVNGAPISQWSEFIQESAMYDEVTLEAVAPEGEKKSATVPTEEWQYGIRMVGGVDARGTVRVGSVSPGMSAAQAGVLAGDVIESFDGEEVLSRAHLISLVAEHVLQTVQMGVSRQVDGITATRELTVTPALDEEYEIPRIGIVFDREGPRVDSDAKIHPLPMKQLKHHASAIFRFLRDLMTPKKSARAANMVGGPVAIITYYIGIIKASLMLAIWFTGFLNINLAIINLLPIPVLDGGHVIFSLWEMITRRPLKAKVVNALVNAFAVLIISVFVLLSLRDVDRHTPAGRLVRSLFNRSADTNTVEEVSVSGGDEQ
jgi:regulator of sigma E protease